MALPSYLQGIITQPSGMQADARKTIGNPGSIFNLIGPFSNPASPTIQIDGTPSNDLAKRLMAVGKALDYEHICGYNE